MVDDLKDAFEDDIQAQAQNGRLNPQEHEPETLYPLFMIAAKEKTQEFKESQARGPQRLCSVPSFALALVLVSQTRRHWLHAPWFTIASLCQMLERHGAVSNIR
jgi:hypothetical protein